METKKVLITSETGLMEAFEEGKNLISDVKFFMEKRGKKVLNCGMSHINEILIKTAARYCTYYCSDIVYDINYITKCVENYKCGKFIYPMGFYDSGVHSMDSVVISEKKYDKVLVFYIEPSKGYTGGCNIGLKEIKKGVY